MKDSPAKQNRKPFSVKNGERTHHVYCSKHADQVATFYCAVCRKPYGEQCVGDERGEQTVCIQCSDTALERELKKSARANNTRRGFLLFAGAAAAVIIAINVFVLINDSPTSEVQEKPKVTQQISQLLVCRHRLEILAKHAASFQEAFKQPPEDLSDLSNLVDDKHELLEPITGAKFLLEVDQQQHVKVHCPNPEAHGLAGLYAVPGKPAKMIYGDGLEVK